MNIDYAGDQKKMKEEPYTKKYFKPITRGLLDKFVEDILSKVRNLKIKSLLDLGCGTGYITQKLGDLSSFSVGYDLDKPRIQIAKKHVKIPLVRGDAKKLPFRDSCFDVVTATELLEHVQEKEKLLGEIKRVSKNHVLITVPNEPKFRLANLLRGKNIRNFGDYKGHVHHFNKKSLKSLLSKYFYEVDIKVNSLFWLKAMCSVKKN